MEYTEDSECPYCGSPVQFEDKKEYFWKETCKSCGKEFMIEAIETVVFQVQAIEPTNSKEVGE